MASKSINQPRHVITASHALANIGYTAEFNCCLREKNNAEFSLKFTDK